MFQRDVFYIAGYDPRSYRYYYVLLKENLVKQNSISHFGLEISPCHLTHNKEVFCQITSQESQTNYHFLTWDKVVRKYWSKTLWNFVCDFIYFLKAYIFSGIVKTFTQKSRTQLLAGFYPIVYFMGSYVLCFVVAYGLFVWIKEWNLYVAIAMILACLWIGTKGILWCGKRFAVFWLSNIYVFCAKYATGKINEIPNLTLEFSQRILKALRENQKTTHYEVILCAHSVGTILAISVIAKVAEVAKNENLNLKNFKVLMLGQCIPLVSFQKYCEAFRREMEVAGNVGVFWCDYTSKIDGACFAMLDYYKASGLSVKSPPLYLSPRFHKLFTPITYKKIRYNWYLAHFLYLHATEIDGKYNYFNFISGVKTLEQKVKE